jgi:hypothetical protein
MGHYSKECPNLPTLPTRENVGSFIRKFSTKEKGKIQVQLIELMNKGQEKVLMGLEESLKILEDVVDVMAQTKKSLEDTTHPNTSVKRFKEMARALNFYFF